MRTIPRSCLLLLATGLWTSVPAMATNVYQWKDAKGVTHSSDKPPAGQGYDTRRIDTRGDYVQATEPAAPKIDPQCETARQNLKVLGEGGQVMRDSDGDGKADTALGEEERAAQKTLAEAAAKAYCPPAG